jgi:zinc transport system substrate-binding protein
MAAMLVYTSAYAKLNVFVSILPQKYFVEKIAGEKAEISVMVAPGASPAVYEPKPKQMAKLSKADIYFSIGVPFEKIWLDKFGNLSPNMKIVRTDEGIAKRVVEKHHHHEEDAHEHEDEGHHDEHHDDHGEEQGKDPHIWLSPDLVKIQAEKIAKTSIDFDPKNREMYQNNLKEFHKEIDATDAKIKKIVDEHTSFMVFHPSWGYFADQYHLEQIPVELEGKAPKPAQLKEFIETAKRLKLKAIFIQPQFSEKSAKVIAKETGAKVIAVDPLAEDWSDNLVKAAKIISGK